SQTPNEGRFPRFTLLVPAKGEQPSLLIPLAGELELTVSLLRRLGPTLAAQEVALVVREDGETLRAEGVAAVKGPLTEISLGDPTSLPSLRPKGLFVEVSGPGTLRAWEHQSRRLQYGSLHKEVSFAFDDWFKEWYEKAADALFAWTSKSDINEAGWSIRPPL